MRRQRGFTLIEVMISLGILAMGLAVLIKSTASNIASTEGAQMDGTATALAREQMYELEEKLQKEGFQDMDEHKDGDFSAEGWSSITWSYDIQAVQLPELGSIQTMAGKAVQEKQAGSGSGSGSQVYSTGPSPNAMSGNPNDMSGVFGNSTLGGMLSMFGGGMMGGMGGSGMTGADAKGASFIEGQYELVKQVLKASIRKVTLTVKWTVINDPRSMTVIEYVTDPAGMQKVLGNIGADGSTPTTSSTTSTSTSTSTSTTKSTGGTTVTPGGK
jgi:prepilin-type N-terminal cleavage/methylation domain-containing protein